MDLTVPQGAPFEATRQINVASNVMGTQSAQITITPPAGVSLSGGGNVITLSVVGATSGNQQAEFNVNLVDSSVQGGSSTELTILPAAGTPRAISFTVAVTDSGNALSNAATVSSHVYNFSQGATLIQGVDLETNVVSTTQTVQLIVQSTDQFTTINNATQTLTVRPALTPVTFTVDLPFSVRDGTTATLTVTPAAALPRAIALTVAVVDRGSGLMDAAALRAHVFNFAAGATAAQSVAIPTNNVAVNQAVQITLATTDGSTTINGAAQTLTVQPPGVPELRRPLVIDGPAITASLAGVGEANGHEYPFVVTTRGAYTITTFDVPGETRRIDTFIGVHNSAGTRVFSNDDNGSNRNSRLHIGDLPAGTYSIRVHRFANPPITDYQITLDFMGTREVNFNITLADSVDAGGAAELMIESLEPVPRDIAFTVAATDPDGALTNSANQTVNFTPGIRSVQMLSIPTNTSAAARTVNFVISTTDSATNVSGTMQTLTVNRTPQVTFNVTLVDSTTGGEIPDLFITPTAALPRDIAFSIAVSDPNDAVSNDSAITSQMISFSEGDSTFKTAAINTRTSTTSRTAEFTVSTTDGFTTLNDPMQSLTINATPQTMFNIDLTDVVLGGNDATLEVTPGAAVLRDFQLRVGVVDPNDALADADALRSEVFDFLTGSADAMMLDIPTVPVGDTRTVQIGLNTADAFVAFNTQTQTLTISPIPRATVNVTLTPNNLVGGNSAVLTVTPVGTVAREITFRAGTGGLGRDFVTNHNALLANIFRIRANSSSSSVFTINTRAITSQQDFTILIETRDVNTVINNAGQTLRITPPLAPATFNVTLTPSSVTGGSNATLIITPSGTLPRAIQLSLSIVDTGFALANRNTLRNNAINFATGATAANAQSLSVMTNIIAADRTVQIEVRTNDGGTTINGNMQTLTVTASPQATFNVTLTDSVTGGNDATLTVTPAAALPRAINLTLSVTDANNALVNATAVGNRVLRFTNGQTGALGEVIQTNAVTADSTVMITVQTTDTRTTINNAIQTLTVTAAPVATINVTLSPTSVVGGNATTLTLTPASALPRAIRVTVAVTDSGNALTNSAGLANREFNFASGATGALTQNIATNAVAANQMVQIMLSTTDGRTNITNSAQTLTVTQAPQVTFSVTDLSNVFSGTAITVRVTPAAALPRGIAVTVTPVDNGNALTNANARTLSFGNGATGAMTTTYQTNAVTSNQVVQFTVASADARTTVTNAVQMVVVQPTPEPTVDVVITDSVVGGRDALFQISPSGTLPRAIAVTVAVVDSGNALSNAAAVTGRTFSFASGQTSANVVTVNLTTNVVTSQQTVQFTVSSTDPRAVIINAVQTLTVAPVTPATFNVSLTPTSVQGGSPATLVITPVGALPRAINLTLAVTDSGNALTNAAALRGQTVAFTSGATAPENVSITTRAITANQAVQFTVQTADTATTINNAMQTLTVTALPPAAFNVTLTDSVVGGDMATLVITPVGTLPRAIALTLTVSDPQNAISNRAALPSVINFANGATNAQTFMVNTRGTQQQATPFFSITTTDPSTTINNGAQTLTVLLPLIQISTGLQPTFSLGGPVQGALTLDAGASPVLLAQSGPNPGRVFTVSAQVIEGRDLVTNLSQFEAALNFGNGATGGTRGLATAGPIADTGTITIVFTATDQRLTYTIETLTVTLRQSPPNIRPITFDRSFSIASRVVTSGDSTVLLLTSRVPLPRDVTFTVRLIDAGNVITNPQSITIPISFAQGTVVSHTLTLNTRTRLASAFNVVVSFTSVDPNIGFVGSAALSVGPQPIGNVTFGFDAERVLHGTSATLTVRLARALARDVVIAVAFENSTGALVGAPASLATPLTIPAGQISVSRAIPTVSGVTQSLLVTAVASTNDPRIVIDEARAPLTVVPFEVTISFSRRSVTTGDVVLFTVTPSDEFANQRLTTSQFTVAIPNGDRLFNNITNTLTFTFDPNDTDPQVVRLVTRAGLIGTQNVEISALTSAGVQATALTLRLRIEEEEFVPQLFLHRLPATGGVNFGAGWLVVLAVVGALMLSSAALFVFKRR